jgi:hypothetical protein
MMILTSRGVINKHVIIPQLVNEGDTSLMFDASGRLEMTFNSTKRLKEISLEVFTMKKFIYQNEIRELGQQRLVCDGEVSSYEEQKNDCISKSLRSIKY